jgi:tRNA(Leu) C34 or U34 (ribose-2'-O)-methylase TrmL
MLLCRLKRAGLDYWPHVCVKVHDSWQAFYEYFMALPGPKRMIGYSVYGSTYYAGPGGCGEFLEGVGKLLWVPDLAA